MQKFIILFILILCQCLSAQDIERPSMKAEILNDQIVLDGILNEDVWKNCTANVDFKTTEPIQGNDPEFTTSVKVVANNNKILIGVRCDDSTPGEIVRFSKLRDSDLSSEDHIRVVIDPFLDGQSGYILAVNANGARYDALISNRGESENSNWDAAWEAFTTIDSAGWSLEISIPIQSIAFKKGLTTWGFNIQRRVQRLLETSRWANVKRDQWFTQTSRAGLLTGLPQFDFGLGLNIRPSLITSFVQPSEKFRFAPSLDVNKRIGPNIVSSLTINTDFAEADVDTRQTNLTRFPLFFPERRSFFLEGSDIFEFGIGTGNRTVLPFFSRRIGLFKGNEVPINAGLKLNGRVNQTAFGALATHTGALDLPNDRLSSTNMGVFRVRRNIWKESAVGVIATVGDPQGRLGSWLGGADFTYQTTRFRGNKNFLAGGWFLYNERQDLRQDRSAAGFKIDYPNDRWDIAMTYARLGKDFDPSMGFIPRRGVHYSRFGLTFSPRPQNGWLRQMFHEFIVTYIREIDKSWQSYNIFTAPINWRLESGDRVEINYNPQGENLTVPFEISNNVTIPKGAYHFNRYRLEGQFAAKRPVSGQLTWWFGSFYEGKLDEIQTSLKINPSAFVNMEASLIHNNGRLPWGNFHQTLVGFRIRLNITPDLQVNSFAQYDTESKSIGWNARAHWIFHPLGDAFLVFNNNTIREIGDRWALQNRQILFKVRYTFRY
jgi:hypothetical protein